MFENKMHFLFSLRKKYIEKFGLEFGLDYKFFKAASEAYGDGKDFTQFFNIIRRSDLDALHFNVIKEGFDLPFESCYVDEWNNNFRGGKEFTLLFYDEEGRFVGDFKSTRDSYAMKRKFIRLNAVWLWMMDIKVRIKDDEHREKLLSKGKALGPYEIWFYWLLNVSE